MKENKVERVLLIYPDPYLAYSPTTLNLYEQLSYSFEVQIITFEPNKSYSSQKINDKNVLYISLPRHARLRSILDKIKNTFKKFLPFKKQSLLGNLKSRELIKRIKKFDGRIVAVDFFALWCVQRAGKSAHLLSLEIFEDDIYRDNCTLSNINSVIVQSEERYKFLFNDLKLKAFYIQNAPRYLPLKIEIVKRDKYNLIFCGSAMPGFGLFSCIEFIRDYPAYSLTIKGAIPSAIKEILNIHFVELIDQEKLVLNEDYMSEIELNEYLNQFRIGFVFYDYLRFDHINKFNYHTAPSGKLFQYYNAGIPVVANNVAGLSSVNDQKAGIVINTMGSLAIKKAIDSIEENYDDFANSSKQASLHYDSTRGFEEFTRFLLDIQ